MTRGARKARKLLLLTSGLRPAHEVAGRALSGYFRARLREELQLESVDLLQTIMPNACTLARLAERQGGGYFPSGVATFESIASSQPTNPFVGELMAGGMERAASLIAEADPDGILATSSVAGSVAAHVCGGRATTTAVVHTDWSIEHEWVHPSTDLHFVAAADIREELVVQGVPWSRVVDSGIPVRWTETPVPDTAACRRALRVSDRFTVTLAAATVGPGDLRGVATRLAECGIQVLVAILGDERGAAGYEALARRSPRIRVFDGADSIGCLAGAADLVVAHPGATVIPECLTASVPLIIYTQGAGGETRGTDYLVNWGAALISRHEADTVEKARFLSSHPDRLAQMAERAAGLGRSDATQSVCERMLTAI